MFWRKNKKKIGIHLRTPFLLYKSGIQWGIHARTCFLMYQFCDYFMTNTLFVQFSALLQTRLLSSGVIHVRLSVRSVLLEDIRNAGPSYFLCVNLVPHFGNLMNLHPSETIKKKHIEALSTILRAITENLFVDFIGLFECKAYFLPLIVLCSFVGHDSKETIKPLLNYLDRYEDKTHHLLS